MLNRRHHLPAEVFAVLADGGGGAAAVRQLAAADLSRRMLLVRGVVAVSRDAGHDGWSLASAAYELLAAVQEESPAAVDAVLKHPSVGVWAWRTVMALTSGRPGGLADPAGLALVAAAAAIRARFACELPVPVTSGSVMFPSLGEALLPAADGGRARLRSGPDGAELADGRMRVPIPGEPGRDAAGWRGLREISADTDGAVIRLVIDDLDPHRMPLTTLQGRLGADEAQRWESGLAGAWQLLVRRHGGLAAEVSAAVRVLTPLLPSVGGAAVSATTRDAFGCVGISTAADPLELAATLAHEVQHAKLYQIAEVEPLVLPDDDARYYAPWRTDPRPVGGLLQGAYAYLGVTGFWRTQQRAETHSSELRAHVEFARWRDAVAMVTQTLLDSRRLTLVGEEFVGRMARVVRSWCAEPVPAEAAAQARGEAERHARRWRGDG